MRPWNIYNSSRTLPLMTACLTLLRVGA
ncbi:hypothetical protein A6R68_21599, partial [Neotoma lepida]